MIKTAESILKYQRALESSSGMMSIKDILELIPEENDKSKEFYDYLIKKNINFFSGVPDSLLKDICAYIDDNSRVNQHVISANEGNSVAMAAGYHLATGKIPMVYMQNSGLEMPTTLISLTNKEVYSIPILLMIGWKEAG